MKTGGPWNLRGLRPEARAAAREAARRSGMSVGEWLNTVIAPVDEDDEDARWFAEPNDEQDDRWEHRERHPQPQRERQSEVIAPTRSGGDEAQPRRELTDEQRKSNADESRDRHEDAPAPARRPGWASEEEWRRSFRDDDRRWSVNGDAARSRRRDPDDRTRLNFSGGRERGEADAQRQRRDRTAAREPDERKIGADESYRAPRRQGGYYPEERDRADRPDRAEGVAAIAAAEDRRDAQIDKAVAEIAARQRALDAEAAARAAITGPPPTPRAPPPERTYVPWSDSPHAQRAAEPVFDLTGLEGQLRQITARLETLRPSGELETAINGLRSELSQMGRSLTEALPRSALESLEFEVKSLGQRIDHGRQSGVDSMALAGIERGLAEVREALRGLTPAEGLVGFGDVIEGLVKKIDAIVAKDDSPALRQLEAAVGALREVVSHVASNDTFAKVAEDVRALSAKVDGLAGGGSGAPTLAALENRIDILASALNASTEAGHAVPRELEKLLSGLIEKLEWVQLTHTEHTALAHLEDRIATLVKRLDASDARLGLLEGVERGLADLLVHIDQIRGAGGAPAGGKAPTVGTIGNDIAKQPERRTQDSLDHVQGAVEYAVDRRISTERDSRGAMASSAQTEPAPIELSEFPPATSSLELEVTATARPDVVPGRVEFDPILHRPASTRTPIDPSLPPNHPLEPGLAGRSRQTPTAADRIAESEAAIGSKPPVIPDPGSGKPDFIAAARRAAQAAAALPDDKRGARAGIGSPLRPKTLTERLRMLAVVGAVVVIVVGGFHIITKLFEDGANAPVPAHTEPPHMHTTPQAQTETPRTEAEPPQQHQEPQVQTEPPHVEAEPAPAPAIAQAPVLMPDAAQNSAAPVAGSTSGPAASASPRQQSLSNTLALPLDITGSLPSASATAEPPPPAAGDKLPLAIGGPALRLAALAGDPAAAYEVAARFAEGRGVPANNQEAARWFEIAAKHGIAPAQFRLGTLYEKGLGVKKDLAKARDLYRAAADKGHGKAMHNLAVLYAEGADGKADYSAAAEWFRKAADRGVTDSQYNLAILYARGAGVEQNFAESYKWFFLAAKEGDRDAAQKRDEIAGRLDKGVLAAAREAAERWRPLPQPAEAVTVKGAWDTPPNAEPPAKPKPKSAKTSAAEPAKIN